MARFTIKKIKEVAECAWWRKTSRKRLAEKCNLTEKQLDELLTTREYQKKVENLMLSQRSAEDFEKWVKSYKPPMNQNFGERMGIPAEVVSGMVENVRKAHADITAGKAKAPDKIPNPSKNINLNSEKTIGSGTNSVYLYYDQQKRDEAESKDKRVWECKIGRTTKQELHTRIYQQSGTVPADRFKLGLHIKTDWSKEVEDIIHNILKVRGTHIADAPGTEWFLTSPSEVEEIYNFIGEHSRKSTLSTLS